MANSHVLVTGATGYLGGRLIPELLQKGYQVRVMVRDPQRLQGRPWLKEVEVYTGDALKPDTLDTALTGINTAYYLIHSMSENPDFHERDLIAARNFSTAARNNQVDRLIYVGGLGSGNLSEHLQSRQQTGDTLRESGIDVTEFRAGIIVGSGSVSFEMIRYLTERVPIMICPSWVYTRIQPIAIRDVLKYLIAALETSESRNKIIEIGGADVQTYGSMMTTYAKIRGLRRLMIAVPVLTPRLSSYWVHLVTPVPHTIARPLIEGIQSEVIVRNDTAHNIFPDIEPIDYATAVQLALNKLEASEVETTWSDALVSSQGDNQPVVLTMQDGMLIEQRQKAVEASPEQVYAAFTGLGGKRGWLAFNWLWRLRGLMDSMVGGVGFRRGRRHPDQVRAGDALDFWRVEAIEPDNMMRLRAEMKVPGRAWLQFKAEALSGSKTRLTQTAFFAPRGLFGILYWYTLYPVHQFVFSGLIRKLAERALSAEPVQPEDTVPASVQIDNVPEGS